MSSRKRRVVVKSLGKAIEKLRLYLGDSAEALSEAHDQSFDACLRLHGKHSFKSPQEMLCCLWPWPGDFPSAKSRQAFLKKWDGLEDVTLPGDWETDPREWRLGNV